MAKVSGKKIKIFKYSKIAMTDRILRFYNPIRSFDSKKRFQNEAQKRRNPMKRKRR